MPRVSFLRPLLGLLTVTVVLAGCGGSSGNSGSGTGGQPSAAASPGSGGGRASSQPTCALAPASVVNAALGSDLGAPQQTLNGTVTVCTYQGPKAGQVIVRFQTGDNATTFAAGRKAFDANHEPTKDYPGFADEAYTNTLGSGGLTLNTLVARQGSTEILVTSKASFASEQKLEQQLFSRL